jgi:hypothetical protein
VSAQIDSRCNVKLNGNGFELSVYGVDEWSEPQSLITALLREPLASSESQNKIIRDRWKERPTHEKRLTIE